MPAALAIPLLTAGIGAGGMIGSSLIGSKASHDASQAAQQRSPEEMALMKSQTGLADTQNRQSQQLFGTAMPAVNNTLRYYSTLLSGNRGARMAAVSPEAEDVSNAYAGADASLKRSNVRGGERVAQLAENSRAKAGQIARLTTGVRPMAANAMGSMGMGLVGAGDRSAAGANAGYSGLVSNSTNNRQQGNLIGLSAGQNLTGQLGKLFANIMGQGKSGSGGGGSWWAGPSGGGDSVLRGSSVLSGD